MKSAVLCKALGSYYSKIYILEIKGRTIRAQRTRAEAVAAAATKAFNPGMALY